MTNNNEDSKRINGLLERVRQQNQIRAEITSLLKDGPRTVPEISVATGMPTDLIFWHVIAMRKYGKVAEVELKVDYPAYRLVEEKQ
jgi:hypothetical protein